MKNLKQHLKFLFGFRSGTPWKSVLAVTYYAICLLTFVICLFTPPLFTASVWDHFVVKLSLFVILLWMLSPAIFLSNTPMRNKLPFFKKHLFLDSLVGMAVVFILFSYLFGLSESFHTDDYRVRERQYMEQTYMVQDLESSTGEQSLPKNNG